jgi:magnesium and cobalt exporter, CNNM family
VEAVLTIFIILLIPALFCISLLDIALRSVHYYKISSIHRHGNQQARKLFSLLSSPERSISVLLFLRCTLSGALFLSLSALLMAAEMKMLYVLLLEPFLVLTVLIVCEYVPRMLAIQNPERIAFTLLKPFEFVLALNRYFPLPQACERLASAILRPFGFNGEKIFSQYSVNEIKMFLSLRRGNQDTELRRRALDQKFLELTDRRVREVMVARPLIKGIEINSPLSAVLKAISETGYSRLPVFRGSPDNILGVLRAKDVVGINEGFSLEHYLHKPFFIPESATVQTAFQNMRRNKIDLAIVVDEYGGVDGIVSVEDLIEELIGDVQEAEQEADAARKVNDGTWMVEGNMPIKDLNENLNLDLPEDSSYTTVAGFLLTVLDKIPAEKEEIRYGNLLFSVEEMMGNTIAKVFVKVPNA